MKYPLSLQFKILALAPQISVFDADGQLRFYVKQKAFKLKEASACSPTKRRRSSSTPCRRTG